ncbi:MAG: lysine--tRNA ligase [Candidatus Poseidoniaceae archaeon]
MHWSDVVAERLSERGTKHIVSTGITPSGEFHIGHLREILTGDMISKAAAKAGHDVEFVFIVDSADPLRKVYSFLDDSYSQYIGHQLKRIPPPNEDGRPDMDRFNKGISYADHFLEPFKQALEQIDVRPRFIDNFDAYASGKFAETARIACNNADKIREIIERVSSRELADDWFPWNPIDSNGSIDGIRVTGWNDPVVSWTDSEGNEGTSDVTKGEGKLPWRIDWPAKWAWIGVTMEPFGKDHGAAGGSYDTGKEIVELFGRKAPLDLTYEWISLRGQGAMSSSSGNTIGPLEALSLVPPEILRYLIASTKPNKAIEFDTGMGLVNLADEFERTTARDFSIEMEKEDLSRRQKVAIEDAKTALELSLISPLEETATVTFRHLAMLAQTKSRDEDVWTSLGLDSRISQTMIDRLHRMRTWVKSRHFPDELRITILDEPKSEAIDQLNEDNIAILPVLIETLKACDWDADAIQSAISSGAKSLDMSPRHAYRALYLCIMGTERGPRLPTILAELDQNSILNLLNACLESKKES